VWRSFPSLDRLARGHFEQDDVSGTRDFAATGREEFAVGAEAHRVDLIREAGERPFEHPVRSGRGHKSRAIGSTSGEAPAASAHQHPRSHGLASDLVDRTPEATAQTRKVPSAKSAAICVGVGGKCRREGFGGAFLHDRLESGKVRGRLGLRFLGHVDRGVGGGEDGGVLRFRIRDAFYVVLGVEHVALHRGDGGLGGSLHRLDFLERFESGFAFGDVGPGIGHGFLGRRRWRPGRA